MPLIETKGNYNLTIKDPYVEEIPAKDGQKPKLKITIPGRDEGGDHIYHTMFISDKIVSSGKNAGKKQYEVCQELLKRLGVKSGDPAKVHELDGLMAEFVVDSEVSERDGKTYWNAKFINPIRKRMTADEIASVFGIITSDEFSPESDTSTEEAELPSAEEVSKASDEADDDVPF